MGLFSSSSKSSSTTNNTSQNLVNEGEQLLNVGDGSNVSVTDGRAFEFAAQNNSDLLDTTEDIFSTAVNSNELLITKTIDANKNALDSSLQSSEKLAKAVSDSAKSSTSQIYALARDIKTGDLTLGKTVIYSIVGIVFVGGLAYVMGRKK